MKARAVLVCVSAVASICIGMSGGCSTTLEDWEVWEVDWQRRLKAEDRRQIDVPDEYKAEPTGAFDLPSLEGDAPLKLSIEQATLLAMRHNRDLAVEQLSPVIVGAFEQIERGVFDPEVFTEANLIDETGIETARSTGASFSVDGRDTDVVAGIRQRLPSGTVVEGTVSQERTASNRAPEQQEARLGLTITQSLLRGYGRAVNLARIRQARQETVASQYELRRFTEALFAAVEIAYWQFVLATDEIVILERSLEVATQQAKEIQQKISVGALAEIEAAAALAEVSLRQQALIDGSSVLNSQRLRLLRLLNPDGDGSFSRRLTPTTPPQINPEPIENAQECIALADKMRPDLNEARVRFEERRLETIVTRNGVLPKLDLFIALGMSGFADTFTDSFEQLDTDTYDFTAGVRFSHMLGNRAAGARDRSAIASRRQAVAAVANLRQLVQLEVLLALDEVERTRLQIAATQKTREFQGQAVAAEKQRFDAGTITSLDLARAQRDLLVTQIAEVEAVVRYRIALVNLYLTEGSLLERRGVVLDVNNSSSSMADE